MKRRFFIALSLFLFISGLSLAETTRDNYRIKTVVIDAGHGGHDAGCLGASAREKHIALDIALKLGKLIESSYPDIKVVYTRKSDVFIPLHERANIANRAHADLFICIHLNAGGKGAYGAETFVMGNHKSEDNLEVAKRENASILLEDDYLKKYDGFDPNSPEANIIFSLYQSQFMNQSLLLASNIQEEFSDFAGRYNRGVKQAGFLVLYKTAMPAVLIECGFLTHEPEEKFLASEKGQQIMSGAIFRAFKEYKVDMEAGSEQASGNPVPSRNNTVNESPAVQTPPDTLQARNEGQKDTSRDTLAETKTQPPSAPVKAPVPGPAKPPLDKPTVVPAKTDVYFTIQVGASKNPGTDTQKFTKEEGISAIPSSDGFTRYVIGSFSSLEAAKKKLAQVKANGKSDAFLTAFKGNQRISIQEAEQLLKRP
ncbi:MAG: N-acetylmuramoyl-L-alanine amidase [Bacteroidia bacterium]|nr:N-acetylmuramoyl-L-alanine amidase [Bacteroidia bacterium]